MASYDLRCGACGQDFELFVQGFLKEEQKICPECGSRDVAQRFTGFLCGSASGPSSADQGCGASRGFG
jgi:putative FmdB family regulatory protein